ncbi:hypothetical protein J8L98_02030 [Pseudoalteromonas sp. MMG013]|uniref:Uncharacterized protein n=1 Tax=Pseudoalteromonas aurantia 208 TaxID=1314867 RepID=A0ABR9EHS1_9GAMM|nr:MULTISPECIES: hypothetical protein [Pseudoalteromonas]MBE0370545.1 hypothetical protein [Pseudoalteromonas aurantia 208]MBQ4845146.1 hypothetical protein [Pseudoalteromonas sp. MMG005]MBQ4860470.1 hypothetical protein [Pseudoalteromonas sp. MMG013]
MKITLNKRNLKSLSQKPLDTAATKDVAGGFGITGPCSASRCQPNK